MTRFPAYFMPIAVLAVTTYATEFHVAVNGDNANKGSKAEPFKTISAAAQVAQPGDTITVHAGIYREHVNPPRGGTSDQTRITYQAAPGEKVVITGSEQIKGWEKVQDNTWKVTISNTFFGNFNPYSDLIHGDWFKARGRQHHTGAVYLNGEWRIEAAKLDDLLKPADSEPLWFGQVDKDNTTIWAQFKGVNPNEAAVEINVRQTVFTPEKTGINYVTVRGFDLRNGAPPWAPPTAKQIGIVSALWCKGWIIEDNEISYSKCCGVALGKYGDKWDNRAESAEGYVGTLNRALTNGWNKATVGSHIVRNNHIHHCDQTGVVGSLGCSFSTVTGNVIHDINLTKLFGGAEMAGIKFHGAIDVTISHNHIYHCSLGIWLDWMNQGARVSSNLLHDNLGLDLFFEVNHGPFMVDNNILLSRVAVQNWSQGCAYAHNLVLGSFGVKAHDGRMTPFHKPHSTEVVGLHDNPNGDDRYCNNLIVERGSLAKYDGAKLPVFMNGNVLLKGAKPSVHEKDPILKPDFDPAIRLVEKADGIYIEGKFDKSWVAERKRQLVTTESLGKAFVSNAAYESPDGSAIKVNTDYFGKKRDEKNPFPGPFENPGEGIMSLKVW